MISGIKELLEKESFNYRHKIIEILFKSSQKYVGPPNVMKFLDEVESMAQDGKIETWEILSKIEAADIVLDGMLSDCYYQADKHRFLKGISKKSSKKTGVNLDLTRGKT